MLSYILHCGNMFQPHSILFKLLIWNSEKNCTKLCSIFKTWPNNKLRQWPTWCTLALFYNMSTTILYMFRALHAHHQEVELYWCSIWYRPLFQWPSGKQVERELQFSQPVHRTVTEWEDDTRCYINTIQRPDDEHVILETCTGL